MPGPVVHAIIAEQLPDTFESEDEARYDLTSIAGDVRDHRTALVYGAQGPDPFFFNPDDLLFDGVAGWWTRWTEFRAELTAKLWEFTRPLHEIKAEISDHLEMGLDELESRSHVLDQFTNLQARFKYLSQLIGQVLRGYVKVAILDGADPFGLYISPMNTCGQVKSPPGVGDWKKDHKLWWWFDNLHIRRTGDFASELLDIATGEKAGADGETKSRPLLTSYAVGYLSHVAADTVGHAYVNCITGGPYRLNQSQRHTAQEKVMDVWAYDHYYSSDRSGFSLEGLDASDDDRYYLSDELVDSGMHKNFQFTAGDIEPIQWVPDPERTFSQGPRPPIRGALKLPDEIADNVAEAAGRTYDESIYGPLTSGEVASSYRSWYKMFQSSTSTFSPPAPDELPGDVDITGPLKEELEEFAEESSDVWDALTDLLDSIFDPDTAWDSDAVAGCVQSFADGQFDQDDVDCLEGAAEAINGYLAGVAASVANLFKQVVDVFVSIFELVEAVASIPLVVLNYLLQKAYEGLWATYKNLLMLVTAIGFGTMYSEDLQTPQLKNMWDPEAQDAAGRTARDWIVKPREAASGFPRKGLKAGHTVAPPEAERLQGLENDAHLLVPFTEVEQPRTIPGPDVYGTNTPEVFIDDPQGLMSVDSSSQELHDALAHPLPNDEFPAKLYDLEDYYAPTWEENAEEFSHDQLFKEPVLGDAVTLTTALLKVYKESGRVPNYNMGADRAIGFPTWASTSGCGPKARDRWDSWHGDEVPWIHEPIDPVFRPDEEEYY